MATYGSIGEFDSEKEEWIPYIERLDEYFIANGVEDETKKRAILLSSCGHSTYQIARRLFAPTKLNTQTYGKVVESLSAHFSPKPKDMVQRCKFNARVRQPGESMSTFCAELRSLAEHCNFEAGAKPEHDAKHVDVKDADTSTVPSGSTEQPTDSSGTC